MIMYCAVMQSRHCSQLIVVYKSLRKLLLLYIYTDNTIIIKL